MPYCDRMDLALAVADVVVARAGSATVSELSGLGIPSVFVPYPVGNGEQVKNATDVIAAGGARICLDAAFTPDYVRATLIPLLHDEATLARMSSAAKSVGIRDGASRLATLVRAALATTTA
jgi:UDP-N-acetylglucosamine--N-acetylmuramyl-(pentapeptide) pyrophosphoryl-undecaprenol N-acetylglucosamine transferase